MRSITEKSPSSSLEGQYQTPLDQKAPPKDETSRRVEEAISKKIFTNLAAESSSMFTLDPSGQSREINQLNVLGLQKDSEELTKPSEAPKQKRKKKKKKKKSSPSSSGTSPKPSPSPFKAAIHNGKLPSDFALFSMEENALLQEILDSSQLGGGINLIDLLGLKIDQHYSNLLPHVCKLKSPSLTEANISEETISFQAHFGLIFVSLLAESNLVVRPALDETYFDNRYLLTRSKSIEVLSTQIMLNLEGLLTSLSAIESQITSTTKTGRIREFKLRPINEMRQEIEKAKQLVNLYGTLLKSKEYGLPLLLDTNLFGLCGKGTCKIQTKEEGYAQLKKLVAFQKNLIASATKKNFLGLRIPAFTHFADHFPAELSTSSLLAISREAMDLMESLLHSQSTINTDLNSAIAGQLSFKEYCIQNNIKVVQEKKHQEFISSLWTEVMALSLVNAFAQDIYNIIDIDLMPLLSNVYAIKRTSYNRMVLNWMGIRKHIAYPPSFDPSPFPHLSSLPDFSSVADNFKNNSSAIEKEFLCNLFPFYKAFESNIEVTSTNGCYSPIEWVQMFSALSPFLEEWLPKHVSRLTDFKAHYIKMGKQIIEKLPSEVRIAALQEYKELLMQQSLQTSRITLFCTDLRALMDLYDVHELESESFLLPKELENLLQLSELDNLIEEGLAALSQSESSSEEEEITAPITSAKEATKEALNEPQPPQQKQKSVVTPKKQTPTQIKPRKHSKRIAPIKIPRNAKMRNILKEIKDKLGLTPQPGEGSHRIIRDDGHIAVIPFHGGSSTLPRGTAKSLEDQLAAIVKQRNQNQ